MTDFSLRIFLTDYYLTKPIPNVDLVYNEFTNKDITQIPIIRVFGTTPKGQKVCAHIHGVFPYFYVPFMDDLAIIHNKDHLNKFLLKFADCLNGAMKSTLEYNCTNNSFVYRVVLVKGKQFYGYQDDFQYFLKIYFYNPMMMKRAVELLQNGAVMNKNMQPFEAHISYNLKFFIDYNLYGMNFLFTDAAKFRSKGKRSVTIPQLRSTKVKELDEMDKDCQSYPDYCNELSSQMFTNVSQKIWNPEDIIFGNNLMDPVLYSKISSCELEVDISACDILNILEVETQIGQNPGLRNLWEEEKQRRMDLGLNITDLTGEPYEERPLAKKTNSENNFIKQWNFIVESVKPVDKTEQINEEVNDFLCASDSDDDVNEQEKQINKTLKQELITQNSHSNVDDIVEEIKPFNSEWDDDDVMLDFINNFKDEDDSILNVTLSKTNKNKDNSFDKVTQLEQQPVENKTIVLDSDSDSEDLFSKTFIDLSLNDSEEEVSSSNEVQIEPKTKKSFHPAKEYNSSTDLFESTDCISLSSSEDEIAPLLELYDGADDEDSDIEKAFKNKRTIDSNVIRSPIITRSQKKRHVNTENILIPMIKKKIQMEKSIRKNKKRLGLKLINQSCDQNITNLVPIACTTKTNGDLPATDDQNKTLQASQVLGIEISNESIMITNDCQNGTPWTPNDIDHPSTSRPIISTPVRCATKRLSQQFCDISPIYKLKKLSKTSTNEKPTNLVSFSIPTVSQESPHPSPSKISTHSILNEKSERLQLLNEMRKSVTQNIPDDTGNSSMINQKICETCHLTILSGESFNNSRLTLNPNPKVDEILMFFYAVHNENDIPEEFSQIAHSGVIYVDYAADIMRKAGLPRSNDQHFVKVANEVELMDKIIELVWEFDPDILVGFETVRSSWGYLLERSFNINHKLYHGLGRLLHNTDGLSSKNSINSYKTYDLHCTGRMILDLWIVIKHEIALNSYTLENCASEILKERVPYYTNQQLMAFYRSNTDRDNLMDFFYYRVLANIRILTKMNLISQISEFARIYGIEFYHVLSRGSQYRVESMMLRLAKPQDLIAISPGVSQRAQQKANECIPLTLEPKSGLYRDPVVVLDFQSLYPSVMIAYNYCYATTLGKLDHILDVDSRQESYELGCSKMRLDDSSIRKIGSRVSISPNGVAFVRPEIEKGIISKMVEEILNTRIMVKKSMKIHAANKSLCKLLNARQLGLKLIANVTFGYTAANYSGRMPCVEVGDSIVRKSRETLEETIKLVNSGGPNHVSKCDSEGGWAGCKVIYGDTDSVFVLMPNRTKDEAFVIGARIADAVTSVNPFPVKLKFEKVFLPCLLEAKKRYVGLSYEVPDQIQPKFDAKGIETVRRDNCGIVGKILERSLNRLFTSDINCVKRYVTQQLDRILRGDINISEFIIAKEYRGRGGYKANSSVPALYIANKLIKKDPRAEPLSGERVPYVIIQGAPGDTLISCVRQVEEILFNTKILKAYGNNIRSLNEQGCKLSYTYYITKQILPPLNRALTLIGQDVFSWYSKMPKRVKGFGNGYRGKCSSELLNRTISSYFQSQSCMICNSTVKPNRNPTASDNFSTVLCESCLKKGNLHIYLTAMTQLKDIETHRKTIVDKCFTCTNTVPTHRGIGPPCVSKDCAIFFDRIRAFQQPTVELERLINSNYF